MLFGTTIVSESSCRLGPLWDVTASKFPEMGGSAPLGPGGSNVPSLIVQFPAPEFTTVQPVKSPVSKSPLTINSVPPIEASEIVVTPGSTLRIYHGGAGEAHNFDMSGGSVVNENLDPANVTLFSATDGSIDFTGSAQFYGLIYAPNADFRSAGNSEVFGAVITKSILLTGSGEFHFDENMIIPAFGADVYFVKLARSLSTP